MSTQLTSPVGDRDHVAGPRDAPVTLVEYGDFECPYCGMAHPIVKAAQRRMKKRLCFVFRHFPLTQAHPHAERAAEAAEAADMEGKFWEMHDMLFEHQDALEDDDLLAYALSLELDVERVRDALEAGLFLPRVREDFRSGVRSGVNGTPTFFINGVRYDGSWTDPAAFIRVLDAAAELSSRA
jgi:protein-disulfide isomerase